MATAAYLATSRANVLSWTIWDVSLSLAARPKSTACIDDMITKAKACGVQALQIATYTNNARNVLGNGNVSIWWNSTTDSNNICRVYGTADIIAYFCTQCRANGLGIILYHGIDPSEINAYGSAGALQYHVDLVTELLTKYGAIDGVWFDAGGPMRSDVDWTGTLRALVNTLQPACLFINNCHDNQNGDGTYQATHSDLYVFEEYYLLRNHVTNGQHPAPYTNLILAIIANVNHDGAVWDWATPRTLEPWAFTRSAIALCRQLGVGITIAVPMDNDLAIPTAVYDYLKHIYDVNTLDLLPTLNATQFSATSVYPTFSNVDGGSALQYGPQQVVESNFSSGSFYLASTNCFTAALRFDTGSNTRNAEGLAFQYHNPNGNLFTNNLMTISLDDKVLTTEFSTTSLFSSSSSQSAADGARALIDGYIDLPRNNAARRVTLIAADTNSGMQFWAVEAFYGGAFSALDQLLIRIGFKHLLLCNGTASQFIGNFGTDGTHYKAKKVSDNTVTTLPAPAASILAGDTASSCITFDGTLAANITTAGGYTPGTGDQTILFVGQISSFATRQRLYGPATGGLSLEVQDGSFGAGNKIYLCQFNGGGNVLTPNQTLSTNTTFSAIGRNSTGSNELFVNGVSKGTQVSTPAAAGSAEFCVSGVNSGGWVIPMFGKGGVYGYVDRALTNIEIVALNNGFGGTFLVAGVLTLVSIVGTTASFTWTAGSNGSMTVTGKLQYSADGGVTWSDVAGATSSPATDSLHATLPHRVLFTDTVSADVGSNVVTPAIARKRSLSPVMRMIIEEMN